MQASAKLTHLVKTLCARYKVEWWNEQVCLRLVMPDVEHYLQIENLGNERISIGLYLDFGGKSMPELEIVLWSGFQPEPMEIETEQLWAAIESASIYDTWQLFVELARSGAVVSCFDPAGQSKLAMMANDWSDELKRQGWLGENVWLSRCADDAYEKAIWERDLMTVELPDADDDASLNWLTMPDFEEAAWTPHEFVNGTHHTSDLWVED